MFKNILRTSRWLARRQINIICSQMALRRYSGVCTRTPCIGTAVDRRFFSNIPDTPQPQVLEVNQAVFEEICNETLESLCDHFEEVIEASVPLKGADVTYTDGVLTVNLGPEFGTYVINRQSPNKQIWLSSPISGPKRYDLIITDNFHWIYKHDGMTLHKLLQHEITKIVGSSYIIDFLGCAHSR